jgi:uncharacterized protein
MKHRKISISFFILIFSLFALTLTPALADSIKDRMKSRIPAINALKSKGVIGENNKGYLQYLGKQRPDKNTVNGENTDRKKVYSVIAKKQGVSADLVGQRRAKKIAQLAKPGHKYQTADGKWHQK